MAIGRTEQPQLATTPDGKSSRKDIKEVLESLIQSNQDAAWGFRSAADNLENSDFAETLQRFADQRASFASELIDLGARHLEGDEPGDSVSTGLHRAWADVKQAFRSGDRAIIEAAEAEEKGSVATYTRALEADLPPDLDVVVRRQYRSVAQAGDRIRTMRATSS